MRGLVLLSVLFISAICNLTQGDNKFPLVINFADRGLNGVVACVAHCAAINVLRITKTAQNACGDFFDDLSAEYTASTSGGLNDSQSWTNLFGRQGSSPSKVCNWLDRVIGECVEPVLHRHCAQGVTVTALQWISDYRPYICSLDPPMMECCLQYDTLTNYLPCTKPLELIMLTYFPSGVILSTLKQDMKAFYKREVEEQNGINIYNAFKSLGSCMSNLVRSSPGPFGSCSEPAAMLDTQFEGIINYVNNTDMFRCTLNPDVWDRVQVCGDTLTNDVTRDPVFTPQGVFLGGVAMKIALALVGGEYSKFSSHYQKFKACMMPVFEEKCGRSWTYNIVRLQLNFLLDPLFESDVVAPSSACSKRYQSNAAMVLEAMILRTMVTKVLLALLVVAASTPCSIGP